MKELIGRALGPYQIELKIGQGGMAAVFKAYQANLDRYVAIKVLPPALVAEDPGFARRFQREARSIARLSHPHILPIHDFGLDQGYSYIIMPYVESGRTLQRVMRQSLSRERAIALVTQIGEALAYAHEQGVIHRDLKPSNVLMDGDRPLLSDFGLARIEGISADLTASGRGLGTPAYMSPEQFQGRSVDRRTDIYALGLILYQMLTETLPHKAETPWAIGVKRTSEPPPAPRDLDPTIPKNVEAALLRALATKADDRYEQVTDFIAALRRPPLQVSAPEAIEATAAATVPSVEPVASFLTQATPVRSAAVWYRFIAALVVIGGLTAAGLLMWGQEEPVPVTPSPNPRPTEALVKESLPTATIVFTPTATPTPTDTPPPPPTPSPTPAPRIRLFEITPAVINAGEEAVLTWDVEGVVEVEIISTSPDVEDLGWLPGAGRRTLTPAASTTYVLAAPGLPGRSISITVRTPTPTSPPTPTVLLAAPPPTPTPAARLPAGEFTLLAPLSLEEPSYGPTTFEWEWTGGGETEYGFEVRAWREDEQPAGVHNAALDNRAGAIEALGENRYRLSVDIRDAAGVQGRTGEYLWTVGLVRLEPAYADVGLWAEPARLRFEAGGSSGGDGGGGSGGPTIN